MRLDSGSRLAMYGTLAAACACLIQAEALFLPGIGWSLPPVLGLLAAAYHLEGRWALSMRAASTLAVLLCGSLAILLAAHINNAPDSFAATAPLPVALVPYAGPVFIVLLFIKLFRARLPGDVWQLQAMGLLQAALACVLGGDPLFGLLLSLYLLSALWWLALFHLHQRHERSAASASVTMPRIPWRWAGIPRAFRWLFLGLACGVVLSLVTPRLSPSPWSPLELLGQSPGAKAETGVPASIDLNRVGQVEVNDEVVMEIEATDAGGNPKLDLGGDQRFRGAYLDQYDSGRWRVHRPFTMELLGLRPTEAAEKDGPMQTGLQIMGKRPNTVDPPAGVSRSPETLGAEYFDPEGVQRAAHSPRLPGPRLPDLGPTQYFLRFTVKARKAGGLFVADPVLLLPEHPYLPVAPENTLIAPNPLFSEVNGAVIPISSPRGEIVYRQVTRPVEDPDLGPPVEISPNYQRELCVPPPQSLLQWIDDLARRLASQPGSGLRADDISFKTEGKHRVMLPAQREKVARTLCAFLRNSGEYSYTLNLRREDRTLDPTEDFLRNVKEGHCVRYAGALALMLRGVGIPARIVKGFRGCRGEGEGTYDVRNSDVHTWVEALVSRPGADGRVHLHWLALDPTPLQEAPPAAPFSLSKWWENCRILSADIWRVFVAEYGTEEQSALADTLLSQLSPGKSGHTQRTPAGGVAAVLIGVPLLLAALVGIYWLRRKRRGRMAADPVGQPAVRFYARLLDLLGRHRQLRPSAAQTPREFGATAAGVLRDSEATAEQADVPAQVVALFYRVRYGGASPAEAEREAIDQRLDALAAALAGG